MRLPRWSFVHWIAALAFFGAAGRPAAAAERRIELGFPEAPGLACGLEVGGIQQVPADNRAELEGILELAYDDIVAVYGEPMLGVDKRKVAVYFTPGTKAGMYLTHKSEVKLRLVQAILGGFLAGPAGATCGLAADVPDHAIFIDPDLDDRRNIFLHELIHVFHDRQSYLGWYVHSWVEEGMTEAATELVVDRLRQRGVHDLDGSGFGHTAWDNLKHYDPWSYPFNGAWLGDPRFSVLGSMEFYQGSFMLLGFGDKSIAMPPVIPSMVRYAAASSVWLMMAKAFSPDPASPDFLRRVNARIAERGLRDLPENPSAAKLKVIGLLEEVRPGATMEGLPLREWLLSQAILKGAPAGQDFLFLDVRNPENLHLEEEPITVYAVYRGEPSSSVEPAPEHLSAAEFPARGCPVDVSVIDAFGREVHHDAGTTDARGTLKVSPGPPLEVGAYSIRARVTGACERIEDGFFEAHTPGGMDASTYAVVSGETIDGSSAKANASLFGATVRPAEIAWKQGLRQAVSIVGADASVESLSPTRRLIEADDTLGYFRAEVAEPGLGLDNVLTYVPLDLRVGQRDSGSSWALRHPRFVFKPSPYTRVVWQGTSPDWSMLVSPSSRAVDVGASLRIAATLFPNGVAHGTAYPDCRLGITVPRGGTLPSTLRTSLSTGFVTLSDYAPEVAIVDLVVDVGAGTPPGRYAIPVKADGGSGGTCQGLSREAVFTLDVLTPPVPVSVDAVVADVSPSTPLGVPVRMVTTETDETRLTAFVGKARRGTTFSLEAPWEAAGGSLRFLEWEFDHDPGRRTSDNPVKVTATAAPSVTARYVSARSAVLTIEATRDGSSLPVPIPVTIRWSWSPPRGGSFAGTDTTRFQLKTLPSISVSLDAPARVTVDGRVLEFYAWESGGSRSASTHLLFSVFGDATLAARYRSVAPDTVTLTITALCDGCATGPVSLVGLPVTVGAPWVGVLKTPYSFSMPRNGALSLTAPSAVLVAGRTLRFAYWMSITDWRWLTSSTTLRGIADKTENLAPVYRR